MHIGALDDRPVSARIAPATQAIWYHPVWGRWAGAAVILLAAVLYLATLDNGLRPDELQGGDLITHQYAQVQARPGNAPGYPLYTMGGWLWFRVTNFLFSWALNPIQCLSSYSTVWALLALAVLYHVILRLVRGNWALAALTTLFYAFTYFFWYYSVTTEQYTSAILQTLLIVWLALRWEEHVDRGRQQQADRTLMWLAVVVGSCLANLVTTLFILPPVMWFILRRQPGLIRRPGLWSRCIGLGLLPVLSYGYVYARGAAHPEWRGAGQWPNAWAWFVDFLTTRQGQDELMPGLTLDRLFTPEFPALIWVELTPVALVGGLIGLWSLGRRRALLIGGTLIIYLFFCWVDRFGNWYQVIMPAYPLLVIGLAAGLDRLWRRRRWLPYLVLAGLLALTAYRFMLSLPRADQRDRLEDTGLEPGWAVLADEPQADSVIIGVHPEWLALTYLREVWSARPVVYPQPLCQPQPHQPVRPVTSVYLTRQAALADPTCLADYHRYAAGAQLIQVQSGPNLGLPASARPVEHSFGAQLELVGLEAKWGSGFSTHPQSASMSEWRLSLYWRANVPLTVDYTVSVRPWQGGAVMRGADGQPILQDHQPVWNAYPTSRWLPGEVVRDDYVLSLPDQTTVDAVHIVVYRSAAIETASQPFEILGEAVIALE